MTEQIEIPVDIAGRLDAAGFAYMLTGSMALTFYAQPRFTRAVDLVVELSATDVRRFAALFDGDFACDEEAIAEAVARQRMFNLIHHANVLKFDLIVRKPTPYRRRRRFTFGSAQLWVVSPEDLLLSKLAWGKDSQSELQRRDDESLVQAGLPLDWVYMERWAAELGLEVELQRIRS